MKNYVEQFYNEGFATTFYLKPVIWLKKKIKNKKLLKIIILLIKVLYTVIALMFAIYMFYKKIPF